jgi:hypothetical protein
MRFDRLQQMGCALSASLALNVALLTLVGTARLVRTSEGCATKSETSTTCVNHDHTHTWFMILQMCGNHAFYA